MRKGIRAFEAYTREADLEGNCLKTCQRYGYRLTKLTAAIGDTDRILTGRKIAPGCLYIEIKTIDNGRVTPMTPMQKHNRKMLLAMGYPHLVIADHGTFVDLIRDLNKRGLKALQSYV